MNTTTTCGSGTIQRTLHFDVSVAVIMIRRPQQARQMKLTFFISDQHFCLGEKVDKGWVWGVGLARGKSLDFPDSRSTGSRPLFWNLTSFPPLTQPGDHQKSRARRGEAKRRRNRSTRHRCRRDLMTVDSKVVVPQPSGVPHSVVEHLVLLSDELVLRQAGFCAGFELIPTSA